jgi:ATP synthase protein I
MAQDERPPSFQDFDARLARAKGSPGTEGEGGPEAPEPVRWGSGLQVGIELLAGVGGGAAIGWALDRWLGTAPFLFLVFFFLGAAAGMLNAYRHLRRYMGSGSR